VGNNGTQANVSNNIDVENLWDERPELHHGEQLGYPELHRPRTFQTAFKPRLDTDSQNKNPNYTSSGAPHTKNMGMLKNKPPQRRAETDATTRVDVI
jgi:hypothetical protein